VTIIDGYPAVINDAKLVARMVPLLKRELGDPQVVEVSNVKVASTPRICRMHRS
jgi:hypothetical protein